MGYHYPIDETWSKEEVIEVVHFFTLIEQAYEHHVERDELLQAYNKLKRIVPSKSEEKQLFSQFERGSQYAGFPVMKKARTTTDTYIRMKNN